MIFLKPIKLLALLLRYPCAIIITKIYFIQTVIGNNQVQFGSFDLVSVKLV